MSQHVDTIEATPSNPWAICLEGEHAQLWPYFRGMHAPDFIAGLWGLMAEDKALEQVFQATIPGDELVSLQYDLTAFIRYFDPPDGSRVVIVVLAKATEERPEVIAGLIWFDEIIAAHRASINIWIRRGYRGEVAIEAAHLAVRGAFMRWNLQTLWAATPWKAAYAIARRCGFTPQAQLKGYVHTSHGFRDLHILRATRGDILSEPEG